MAEKRVESPRGSTKRLKEPVQLTPAQFFSLLMRLSLRERLAVAFAGWLGPCVTQQTAEATRQREMALAQTPATIQ